jgi:hypothetical protein
MHMLCSSMSDMCFRNCGICRIRRIHFFNVTQINVNQEARNGRKLEKEE